MLLANHIILGRVLKKNRGKDRKLRAKIKGLLTAVLWVTIAFGAFQTANARQKPDWLINYPADPLYYIGVGGIEKMNNDTEYQAKAREIALSELISQIEVNVSSATETLEQEIDGDYSSQFSYLVQLQAQKTIEDYEIVDSWENQKEYWVYLRLSKQQYKTRLKQKKELAQNLAYKAFSDGEQEFKNRNFGAALSFFTKGLGDVSPYIDQLSLVNHRGEQINLFGMLRSNIQKTLNQLRIVEGEGPEEVRIGKPANSPFSLKVVSSTGEEPGEGIPFQFQFIRGGGELENLVYTGKDGVAKARLSKLIAEDNLQIVTAKLALKEFLPEQASNEFMISLLNSFNTPETRYVIKATGIPVYLENREIFLGEEKTTNYILPRLKNNFNEQNYVFTDNMGEAELYVELEANARKGSEDRGFYSVFLDYKITVTSLLSGEEIANFSVSDIKGVSISYEKAAANAYEAGIDSLENNLISRLFFQLNK